MARADEETYFRCSSKGQWDALPELTEKK